MSISKILSNYGGQHVCGTNSAIVDICGYGKDQGNCRLRSNNAWTGAAFQCASVNPAIFDGEAKFQDNSYKKLTADCDTSGVLTGICLSGENNDCLVDKMWQHTVGQCRPVVDNAFRTDGQPSWNNVSYENPAFGVTNVAGTGSVSCNNGYVATAVCNGAADFDDCHKYGDVPSSVAQASYTFMKCGKLRHTQDVLVDSLATNKQ